MYDIDTDELLTSLGREIRAMRIKRGLSRAEVADAAGIAERQLGKIERGERGQFAEVWQVAAALEVSLSWLVAEAEATGAGGAGESNATKVLTSSGSTYVLPLDARVNISIPGAGRQELDDAGEFRDAPVSDPSAMTDLTQNDVGLAAHDETHTIAEEQEADEFP